MKRKMKLKRVISCLLVMMMLLCALPMQIFSAEENGVPSLNANGYYEIYNADQLYWFAGLVNGTLTDGTAQNVSANAILMNDITVNENVLDENGEPNSGTFTEWTPIGDYLTSKTNRFRGVFDGNNYTVSGLYINKYDSNGTTKYVGMFGLANGTSNAKRAVIKNLTLSDSYIAGSWWVGGIVGDALGTVTLSNCVNNASVKGYQSVGGITGGTENTIIVENCYNNGKIQGLHNLGGLMGETNYNTTVTNCGNTGDVYLFTNPSSPTIGGFIGKISRNSVVTNCYNTGDLILLTKLGSFTNQVGGFIGSAANTATVKNCYFSGQLSVKGLSTSSSATNYVGSFLGAAYGTVENCYYNSEINTEYPAVGKYNTNSPSVTELNTVQFETGEAAYLLNNSVDNGAFKQLLAKDNAPNFSGAPVYKMGNYYTNRYYTADDLVNLRKLLVGFNTEFDFSDINYDSKINISDVVRLKKILAGIA